MRFDFFDEAFAARPSLANDLNSDTRFEAACAAARAAEQAKAMPAHLRLLNQAIAWLRGDLVVWSIVLDRGKESERQYLLRSVYTWRSEPRFTSIRDPEAILAWPPEQQAQCRALWRDVERPRDAPRSSGGLVGGRGRGGRRRPTGAGPGACCPPRLGSGGRLVRARACVRPK